MEIEKKYQFKIDASRFKINRYVQHLATDATDLTYERSENDSDKQYDLLLSTGTTPFVYNNVNMQLQIIESEKTHGLNFETARHVEYFLTFSSTTKKLAEKHFMDFVADAKKFSKEKKEKEVMLYMYKANCGWMFMSTMPKRNMETIYMDHEQKKNLIDDLENFYASADDYKKFGIPYTRKYLFTGLPGVGKTSFIFALASHTDKNIHMLNFNSNLDDMELMSAISSLDNDSILVLEDIDAIFDEFNKSEKSGISFSGLLNTLDGFGRKDRMVVFMTTNHIDKLQDALIRPGRVDVVTEFTVPKKEQIQEMFNHFFPNQTTNFNDLYNKISNKKPSTSLLQKFFFENRNCPNILEKSPELLKLISFYSKNSNGMYF